MPLWLHMVVTDQTLRKVRAIVVVLITETRNLIHFMDQTETCFTMSGRVSPGQASDPAGKPRFRKTGQLPT